MKFDFETADGMCVYAGCYYQAEKRVSWITSKGRNSAPLCVNHMKEVWDKTHTGTLARDTFTIEPLF